MSATKKPSTGGAEAPGSESAAPSEASTDFVPTSPAGLTVRYGFVVSAAGLIGMGVWVVATWIQVGLRDVPHHHRAPVVRLSQPAHGATMPSLPRTQPHMASLALQGISSTRTLKQYYARRAYPGAPPIIPHPVAVQRSGASLRCLSCHKEGGYVPAFRAYTPVVPHPEQVNCTQCHVSQKTKTPFRGTRWLRYKAPKLGQSALPGGPPVVPHSLQGRTNCLACHAGPAAPKEIRTPHPQRIYCTQCHVPQARAPLFRARFGVNGLLPASHRAKPTPRRRTPPR